MPTYGKPLNDMSIEELERLEFELWVTLCEDEQNMIAAAWLDNVRYELWDRDYRN